MCPAHDSCLWAAGVGSCSLRPERFRAALLEVTVPRVLSLAASHWALVWSQRRDVGVLGWVVPWGCPPYTAQTAKKLFPPKQALATPSPQGQLCPHVL